MNQLYLEIPDTRMHSWARVRDALMQQVNRLCRMPSHIVSLHLRSESTCAHCHYWFILESWLQRWLSELQQVRRQGHETFIRSLHLDLPLLLTPDVRPEIIKLFAFLANSTLMELSLNFFVSHLGQEVGDATDGFSPTDALLGMVRHLPPRLETLRLTVKLGYVRSVQFFQDTVCQLAARMHQCRSLRSLHLELFLPSGKRFQVQAWENLARNLPQNLIDFNLRTDFNTYDLTWLRDSWRLAGLT